MDFQNKVKLDVVVWTILSDAPFIAYILLVSYLTANNTIQSFFGIEV